MQGTDRVFDTINHTESVSRTDETAFNIVSDIRVRPFQTPAFSLGSIRQGCARLNVRITAGSPVSQVEEKGPYLGPFWLLELQEH